MGAGNATTVRRCAVRRKPQLRAPGHRLGLPGTTNPLTESGEESPIRDPHANRIPQAAIETALEGTTLGHHSMTSFRDLIFGNQQDVVRVGAEEKWGFRAVSLGSP